MDKITKASAEMQKLLEDLKWDNERMRRQLEIDKEWFTNPKFGCEWADAGEAIEKLLSSLTL